MFFIYGDVTLSNIGISGSAGGASFLTSTAALNDFHSGLIASMSWIGGSQTTDSYVEIDFDCSAGYIGGLGLVNVQGLPEGTLTELVGDSAGSFGQQRLRQGSNGELQAWWLPQYVDNTNFALRIYNDVNGSASIAASATFGIGEIFPGHAIYLPSMIKRTPSASLNDPTAFTTQDAGSVFTTLRKPARLIAATVGVFSAADVNSSVNSTIDDGKGGKVSLRRLQEIFSASRGMAICDIPNAGQGAGTQHGNFRYDPDFISENFILARIQNQAGTIQMDQPPWYSWAQNWRQSI